MTQIISGIAIAGIVMVDRALAPAPVAAIPRDPLIKRIGNVASAVIGAAWAVLFLAHNVYFAIHDPDFRISAKVRAVIYG